jgi:hypothetical protein
MGVKLSWFLPKARHGVPGLSALALTHILDRTITSSHVEWRRGETVFANEESGGLVLGVNIDTRSLGIEFVGAVKNAHEELALFTSYYVARIRQKCARSCARIS